MRDWIETMREAKYFHHHNIRSVVSLKNTLNNGKKKEGDCEE